jgi:hypothetical protein
MGKHSMKSGQKFSVPSPLDLRLRLATGHATSGATRRRITRNVGAVASGLLGLALLPLAVANADEWTITPDSGSQETIAGIYGHGFSGGDTAPPAVAGSTQGEQTFDFTNPTDGTGTFYGFESTSNDGFGDLDTEVYVDNDVTGTGGPATGSVFDSYSFGDGAYTNLYSAIPNGDGTASVTDTLVTPTGDINIPTTFDAADGPAVYADHVIIGNGGTMEAIGSQNITSISGIPPLTVALQGTQDFNFFSSAGTQIGSAGTVDTTTTDGVGTYTEAVLVTNDVHGTVGATAADVPAIGSIYNTIDFFGTNNVYSDLVSAGEDHYTDTLETSLGNYVIPVTFDAAKVETLSDSAVKLPDGFTLSPTDELHFTGINGLPPVDVGVQGGQDFSFVDGANTGTLTADVTNTLDEFNDSTETILVTSSTDVSALPVGSEFEIVNLGNGFESLYSDIAGATAAQDVISETLVTPLGDITLPPSFDAAAGLMNDTLAVIAGI